MDRPSVSICGCGWLGFPLAKALLTAGYVVKGSTTTKEKIPVLNDAGIFSFYLPSCSAPIKEESTEEFFKSKIFVISIPFRRDLSPEENRSEVTALLAHIENAKTVEFVIYTSSTSVYPQGEGVVREDAPFVPDNPRSEGLLKIEQLILGSKVFAGTVVRLGGLYGGSRRLGQYLAGRKQLAGGDQPVNLLHQEDAVGILKAIIEQNQRGMIFNACSSAHPTRRALYTASARKTGLPEPEFLDDGVGGKIVSNEKMLKVLRYRLLHPDPMQDLGGI